MSLSSLQPIIERAFDERSLLSNPDCASAIEKVIDALDHGELRVASPAETRGAEWTVHAWIMKAITLYFAVRECEVERIGPFEFRDKIQLKQGLDAAGVRVVPPGSVRKGAFLERGVIVMPAFVNIGAYVGAGTMVDTWATVGSCAQIGRDCHLAGGVGIGGVLEPPGARPVIVEDGVFIGSRAVIVEGAHIGEDAVIGSGVVITSSTAIIDVRSSEAKEYRGYVPPRSVVIPGVRPKCFPAGEYGVPCALIIGERTASTDKKVSLNAALREFGVGR